MTPDAFYAGIKVSITLLSRQQVMSATQLIFSEPYHYELRFQSLFDAGRGYAFPCDAGGAITKAKHAVMVEGYFDFAQAYQAGICHVVASSGTALTPAQARLLKRFASKVVLSFDPDAAGQGAAARSSELLVAEGFQVNVAMLPPGDDPDNFIRKAGRGGVPGTTAQFEAVPRLPPRSDGGRARFLEGRQPAGVPERDADGRGPDSGRGGA